MLLIVVLSILAIVSPQGRIMLPVQHKAQFEHSGLAGFPGPLRASSNRLVDARGASVRLHGVMPADPARLDSRGMFNRDFYTQIAATGANAVRIAVHPEPWVDDPDYLWRHLDPVVGWAGEMGM